MERRKTRWKERSGLCVSDQYENFMFNSPTDQHILPSVDFPLNGDEQIMPGLLSGQRDEIHLNCILCVTFECYLCVCGCTDRSPIRVFLNLYPLRMCRDHARIRGRVPIFCLFAIFFSFSIYMILKKLVLLIVIKRKTSEVLKISDLNI